MNRRLGLILVTALAVAAISSYVVFRLVRQQIRGTAKRQSTTVILAARDLPVGTLIKSADMKSGELAGDIAPVGTMQNPDGAVGRGVIAAIYTGEPINEQRLAKVGSGAGLASRIPEGMRACAVKVDDVVGVAGFAVPGMRVDVLVSGKVTGGTGVTKVRTLLQNIEVLSAGKNFQQDIEGKPSEAAVVNLVVTPAQAEILSLASSNETRMQLVLRNPLDHQIETPPGSELNLLFNDQPATPVAVNRAPVRVRPPAPPPPAQPQPQAPVPQAAPAAKQVIQVMNGPKFTEQVFDLKGARR